MSQGNKPPSFHFHVPRKTADCTEKEEEKERNRQVVLKRRRTAGEKQEDQG